MRIFLAALALVIILIVFVSVEQSQAQVLPCTVSNGGTLNGFNMTLGAADWQESFPPVRLQQGETITFTFTGGTTIRHRWFRFPVNLASPLLDTGLVNSPRTVPFVAPATGDYDYRFTLTDPTTVAISCVLPAAPPPTAVGAAAPLPEVPPDDRLNWRHGDLMDVVYRRYDAQGNPMLHVYLVSANSIGNILCTLTRADAAPFVGNPPVQNVFIRYCNAQVAVYYLTSDELQINIGPDGEGKTYVLVFNPITFQVNNRYSF